jgi:hypothetical protein
MRIVRPFDVVVYIWGLMPGFAPRLLKACL